MTLLPHFLPPTTHSTPLAALLCRRPPQGAAAMGTFSSKGLLAGAYADGSENHKTSAEVEAHWMSMIDKERKEAGPCTSWVSTFWVSTERPLA